jgi:type VI secretion system protein ImpH
VERDRNKARAVEFFQQVRLLERQLWAASSAATQESGKAPAVGQWGDFADEPIHFRAANSVTHPQFAVDGIQRRSDDPSYPAWTMDVTFMGLTGPMGVLPKHFTTLLLGKGEAARPALRNFLAIFEHRFISRFYRAWELSHVVFGLERAARQERDDATHDFSLAVRALTGLGENALNQRIKLSRRLPSFYSGLFSNLVRPSECLSRLVTAVFAVPCKLLEFVAEWQTIARRQRTHLAAGNHASATGASNAELGSTACVGSRVWTVQDRFCLQLGPLDYSTFARFTPAGDLFPLLCELVRLYAGTELAFDIQPVLQPDAVPPSQLRSDQQATTRLGWNSWLISRPVERPAADAIFVGSA